MDQLIIKLLVLDIGLTSALLLIGKLFLLTILVIGLSRVLALILKPLGQPLVIAEIIAGIILGPTVLGVLFPNLLPAFAPPELLVPLKQIAQIGIAVFMLIMGLELDLKHLRGNGSRITSIAVAGLVIPFSCGYLLAPIIHAVLHPNEALPAGFSLFIATAMSVTAFPVLLRILTDHKIAKTPFGNFVQACAAIDDVAAWSALAVVSVIVSFAGSNYTAVVARIVVYLLGMYLVVRPFMQKLPVDKPALSRLAFLIISIGSTVVAEHIGLHAIFGAFLAGVMMPRNPLIPESFLHRAKTLVSLIALPLFFAQSGLRTDLINLNLNAMVILSAIIFTATISKFGGVALTAKASGYNWSTACALGAAMNARGLVGLIILNAGLDLGVIDRSLFSLMVVMSLFTTFAAGPALCFYAKLQRRRPIDQQFSVRPHLLPAQPASLQM